MSDFPFSHSAQTRKKHFIKICMIGYALMALAGGALMYFSSDNMLEHFFITSKTMNIFQFLAIISCGTGLLVSSAYIIDSFSEDLKELRKTIEELLTDMSIGLAFLLAVLSGVGEELLFRGGIQPFLGLFATSLLFGIIHIGPNGRMNLWTAWCVFAGLVLGWLYESLGTIWPVIIIHFLVNFTSFLSIRSEQRSKK